eukprot:SAG25_NODE_209_length_11844_cov_3.436782_13_plen_50_part_00
MRACVLDGPGPEWWDHLDSLLAHSPRCHDVPKFSDTPPLLPSFAKYAVW